MRFGTIKVLPPKYWRDSSSRPTCSWVRRNDHAKSSWHRDRHACRMQMGLTSTKNMSPPCTADRTHSFRTHPPKGLSIRDHLEASVLEFAMDRDNLWMLCERVVNSVHETSRHQACRAIGRSDMPDITREDCQIETKVRPLYRKLQRIALILLLRLRGARFHGS